MLPVATQTEPFEQTVNVLAVPPAYGNGVVSAGVVACASSASVSGVAAPDGAV